MKQFYKFFSTRKTLNPHLKCLAAGLVFLFAGSSNETKGQVWTINVCSNTPSTTQSNVYGPMYSVATANAANRLATIYPSSQLTGIAAQTLTSVYFHTGAGNSAGMLGTPNLKVYLKEISNLDWGTGALDWATASAGATLVFDGNPAPLIGTTGGWKQIPLTTNFTYSGNQNLALFLEYKNTSASNAISWSYEYTSPCVSGSSSGLETKYSNNTTGTLPTSLASTNSRRPYIGFDHPVLCPSPTNVAISGITINGANITWTAGGNETSWDYAIQPAGGGLPATFTNTNTTTLNPATLIANTNYEFYVRAVCGGTNGNSIWKGPYVFKTLCGAVTSMFENFDSYATGNTVPDCWARIVGGSNTAQTISATSPASGNRNLYQITSSPANATIVVLPEFSNVNAGTHWLRFKARVTSGTGALDVGYVTNITDASTFTNIQTVSIQNTSYSASDSEYSVAVPSSVPANARLAVRNSGTSTAGHYWDDVYWEVKPSCLPPTNVTTGTITASNAQLSWTPSTSNPTSSYDIYYSTSNTSPTSSTTPNIVGHTSPNVTISPLNPATTYYVWVRSSCSSSDKSTWTNAVNFVTQCDVLTGSYFEGFEGYTGTTNGTAGVLPACWTNLGTTNGAHISNSTTITGNNTLYLWTSGARIAYVALPPMTTLQSGNYQLKFDAKASVTAGGILQIGYIDTANNFVELTTFSVSTTNTTYPFSFDIPVLPAGVTQLAIKNPGTPANSLSIDNLSYEPKVLSTSEVSGKNKLRIYPNPFSDIVNIDNVTDVESASVIDVSGRTLKTFKEVSSALNLSDLKEGMYILVLDYKDNTRTTHKIIKK